MKQKLQRLLTTATDSIVFIFMLPLLIIGDLFDPFNTDPFDNSTQRNAYRYKQQKQH